MEMKQLNLVALSFAFITILIYAWRILNWMWLRPKRLERCLKQRGLAGNSYRLLHGDFKEMFMMIKEATSRPISISDDIVQRIAPFHYHSIKKYGKSSFIWMGPKPRVNIMEPELIRDVLSMHTVFRKPRVHALVKLLVSGLLFLDGDAISRTAFGSNYEKGRMIFELQREQAQLLVQFSESAFIPGWRFLPTKSNKRMKQNRKEVNELLWGIIDKREKAMKAGETLNDDLLGILLESNFKEIQEHGNDKNVGMSIKDVIDECKIFYFAGQETTSVLLLWTMVLLSKHPNWQARAREEVLHVFGNNKPEGDGLNHLKIVMMILHEVLRLYPPVPLLARTVYEDIQVGDMYLPAGVDVSLPTILVHHDHEIWGEDAREFNPERFSQGVLKATKSPVSFFPFGWGSRLCIGQNFAILEAKMVLAMILQHFSFSLSPSYSHAPCSLVTLKPQYGAHLILHGI
ncbi:11-oxo-beta-amyrin 30-oxidase [Vitis vinifera]|uniref:11-oxo-beta-amyrin 30-oxidase n=1 Tax=Vitis vinifera TaxID=29760 RepID=A0A438BMD9_VITVI|nr:11-oxo-beta-amyrin 30-oxidase [Vitis vinifera]